MRLTDEQLAVWQHNANALAEELTRLYAIDRAAREYVEATHELHRRGNFANWEKRRVAQDALLAAVGGDAHAT